MQRRIYFCKIGQNIIVKRILDTPLRIGRSTKNSWTISRKEDSLISLKHADIFKKEDSLAVEFWIQDLGSENGTYLDIKSVQSAPLKDGMTLELGRTSFLFVELLEISSPLF